jgi:hypothetical protein
MYLYFLPLESASSQAGPSESSLPTDSEAVVPLPTSDGGVEHTAALFAPLSTWLRQARSNKIILFPPQFYLMYLLAPMLSSNSKTPSTIADLQQQRLAVLDFLQTDGDGNGVKWADKVMSPTGLFFGKDGRSVLALDKPGPELKESGRSGDGDRVVLVKFTKEGPKDVEVRSRKDVLEEEKTKGSKL